MSVDRMNYFSGWLQWYTSEAFPKEVTKDGKDFERDMGFTN